MGGGDPDLPVVTKHEPAGTRLFHALSREIRVDGNNPQGSGMCLGFVVLGLPPEVLGRRVGERVQGRGVGGR